MHACMHSSGMGWTSALGPEHAGEDSTRPPFSSAGAEAGTAVSTSFGVRISDRGKSCEGRRSHEDNRCGRRGTVSWWDRSGAHEDGEFRVRGEGQKNSSRDGRTDASPTEVPGDPWVFTAGWGSQTLHGRFIPTETAGWGWPSKHGRPWEGPQAFGGKGWSGRDIVTHFTVVSGAVFTPLSVVGCVSIVPP